MSTSAQGKRKKHAEKRTARFHDTPEKTKVINSQNKDWAISSALTCWSLYIRLWKISQPSSVVFDEVHFGGFASKYIKQKFFMDVHPPLAKLLITWISQIVGFDGRFDFKEIGKDYLKARVPYTQIRGFCSLNGVLLVPFSYWTIRNSGYSMHAAILTALMICYENGLITNNRFILLDPILLNFTAFTLLMWINFSNYVKQPFGYWWWMFLFLTGIGLGLTVSCKWVGLLTIATIGTFVLKDLWNLWSDQSITWKKWVQHFLARAVCLIICPFLIYLACFKIHFDTLTLTGTGTSFMSPEFQATLKGVKFPETTLEDVTYGSNITIVHVGTRGGYLHSHVHSYPGGSQQQQVTLYSHIDDNNVWTITRAENEQTDGMGYIKHGDIVRLMHIKTDKRLHTHDIRPITNEQKYQHEVSAYGYKGFSGDTNDNWRIEFITDKEDHLRARRTEFRLISVTQHCALFSRKHKLPDWAYGQQEVTCMKDALLPKTIWRIEDNKNSDSPSNATTVGYQKRGFFQKFIELNKVMWAVNQGLSSTHLYASRPKDWPILKRGISFWTKDERKVYLLGNPAVYWLTSSCIAAYALLSFILIIAQKRKMLTSIRLQGGGMFFIAWALHYFPFNIEHRQLFLHHYMPALYMATLLTGVMFDKVTKRLPAYVRWAIMTAIVGIVIYMYRIYIPITYGEPWTKDGCTSATLRRSWDFGCNRYDKTS